MELRSKVLLTVTTASVLSLSAVGALAAATGTSGTDGAVAHEFIIDLCEFKNAADISVDDVAKRLMDFGFHAPTVYFPLVVPEAMMMEPTETESKETLDHFAETIHKIVKEESQFLHDAPHTTPVSRPDEVQAARQPILKWSATKD